ncbi:hypothetical protein D9619_006246 [Psilocybe cf. subviscida]|uniref:Anaphase-promoting complex subunit 4 WD40 domain-containing protein n=1 Tax=Psilocybe cf. subviscida TaxID=2480587 RepID=A0A8H5B5W1_9AGAR|nr:hypothetical protein D9619_006246 [Psilocybe cf. subviscida]
MARFSKTKGKGLATAPPPAKKTKLETPTEKRAKPTRPDQKAEQKASKPSPLSVKGKEKESTPAEIASKPKTKKVKAKTRGEPTELPTSFKIVAGSYEKLLYGLDGTITLEDDLKLAFHLKPSFIFPAHVSCIKAVAASPHGGKWLATGSADEIIKVWDLRRRKEIGGLMHHEGSITHLVFPSRSHLMSASEDGTLCLFRARDWAVLRALKGHKGRVNAIAIHPSGKVALSVGKDRALRMWDLMRGKGVASTKLGKEGEVVRWSIDGSKFVVQSGSTMDVYATNMDLLYTITHASRIQDVKFCSRVGSESELMLVGAEDHKLTIYDVPKDGSAPKIVAATTGHTNRVKAIQTLDIALPEGCGRTSTTIISTVSSDGLINVYDVASVPEGNHSTEVAQIDPITSYDTKGTRLTCVTLADNLTDKIDASGDGKRKRDEEDEDEDEAGGEESEDDEPTAFGAGWEEDEDENEEDEEEGEEDEEAEFEESD